MLVLLLYALLELLRDDPGVSHVRLFDSSIGPPLMCLQVGKYLANGCVKVCVTPERTPGWHVLATRRALLLATAKAPLNAWPAKPVHTLHDSPCFSKYAEADGTLC